MKLSSSKITSDHFLLCVFLSLLWGVTDSNRTSTPEAILSDATEATTTTRLTTLTTLPTTKTPPENVRDVEVKERDESSITLMWDKVNNISTYILKYDEKEDNISESHQDASITHVATQLTAGRKYDFTLITVYEGVSSSGYLFEAVTAPPNAEGFKSIGQNEISITLQWKKVENFLNYALEFNGKVQSFTASEGSEKVTASISGLSSGTKYDFTLFTVFEDARSSGVNHSAVTAPPNAEVFKSTGQNETSITLQWKKVEDFLNYTLEFNGMMQNFTASEGSEEVTESISGLSSGTKYDFTLFTVFEDARSSGVNHSAVTAPLNAEGFKSIGQNETSITLQWKKVGNILNYTLEFNGKVQNVTASEGSEQVTESVSGLRSMNQYDFTLFTVFEDVRSSGEKTTAFTAPENVRDVEVKERDESSITLMWDKVNNISTYILKYDEKEDNISESHQDASITHVATQLTAGRKYYFTLITVSEGVNSSGYPFEAVTAPRNTQLESVTQNETSITLQWKKVDGIPDYILVFNGSEINVTALAEQEQVTHTISGLTSGTEYFFSLFTVFENIRSRGLNHSAVTAPENVRDVEVKERNENSITLMWDKVNNISTYILKYDKKEDNISESHQDASITHVATQLTAGRKYYFTLITVYEGVNSSGYLFEAVTAPPNAEGFKSIGQNETSITLQWKKVENFLNYTLEFNGKVQNVTASEGSEEVTESISGLRSMNQYDFTLFTVFEDVRSSGENTTAFTAPENVRDVEVKERDESSITLMWDKVNNISTYILKYDEKEDNINKSHQDASITHVATQLTAGRKYDFTLITVSEGVNSSGYPFEAVTAPRNTQLESVTQNETSITLQWKKVDGIPDYILVFNGSEINVTALAEQEQVTHTISGLTSGTEYFFSLFTVFENIRSRGLNHSAVTAPRNTEVLESVGQTETSITLQWKRVDGMLKYKLVLNEMVKEVTASEGLENVTYTVLKLTSMTKYNFTLFTVFENVNSSGVNITALTAPGNVNNVTVLTQNESSITLIWNKVNNISTYFLQYDNNGSSTEVKGDTFYQEASVTYEVSSLNAGTKYNFTLITRFEKVNSTGFSFNAVTVPSKVALVNVTERSVTSITLTWQKENKDWDFFIQINGNISQPLTSRALDVVSHSVTSLQPGTEYRFSVITRFSGLNSTAYEGFTVTTIDCSSVTWNVTTSSIQGRIEGLFSNATATYKSQTHVSPGGSNVSFTGLYPGATYNVSLEYERNSMRFHQCSHDVTIIPPSLKAHCEFAAAGYSILIVWNKPDGVWTSVEVNVTGKDSTLIKNGEQRLELSGFQPAKTYEVSLASLSRTVRSDEVVFWCHTDPRGVIAGSVFAILIFCVLVCLAVFMFLKRPDIISRKKAFIGGSKQSKKKCKTISVAKFPDHFHRLGVDENRGFSQEYESLSPVGTDQTRKVAIAPENKPRNRFNNVLPYDWCRVKLSTSNPDAPSDYINASYMPGYNSKREYIATQGPLPSTVDDFWRMIWEQRVKGIVMVTNCTEGGKTKCERYWPADSKSCLYGELLVTIRHEQQEPYWTLREFSVKHRDNSGERTVRHFHFTAWPDHGVPQGTEVLIQFRGLVRQHIEREGTGAPTVVHCSAGVGRTGTIIALDVLLQQLEKERAVGINDFVHKMRLSRPHMVQTESQYVFLHQSIMDCLQPNEKTEENIYENADMIYANATALQELR